MGRVGQRESKFRRAGLEAHKKSTKKGGDDSSDYTRSQLDPNPSTDPMKTFFVGPTRENGNDYLAPYKNLFHNVYNESYENYRDGSFIDGHKPEVYAEQFRRFYSVDKPPPPSSNGRTSIPFNWAIVPNPQRIIQHEDDNGTIPLLSYTWAYPNMTYPNLITTNSPGVYWALMSTPFGTVMMWLLSVGIGRGIGTCRQFMLRQTSSQS